MKLFTKKPWKELNSMQKRIFVIGCILLASMAYFIIKLAIMML